MCSTVRAAVCRLSMLWWLWIGESGTGHSMIGAAYSGAEDATVSAGVDELTVCASMDDGTEKVVIGTWVVSTSTKSTMWNSLRVTADNLLEVQLSVLRRSYGPRDLCR